MANYCNYFVEEMSSAIIRYLVSLLGKNVETANHTKKHVWKP